MGSRRVTTLILILIFGIATVILFERLNMASVPEPFTNAHGNYADDSPVCAKCHSGHNSGTKSLLRLSSQRQTCYSCHDGSNASPDVRHQFGEEVIGVSVYSASGSLHPVTGPNTSGIWYLCTECHDPHMAPDPGGTPGLLAVGEAKISSGNTVCGNCHGNGSILPGGDMLTTFTGTPHDAEMNPPSTNTQIKCTRCHHPHGSPFTDLIRSVIIDQSGGSHTVSGNDNTACFGCHTGTSGNYFGQSIYEQTKHGPGTTVITETTQSDFSTGTLTNSAAISSGELTLAGNPGVSFDGIDDKIDLTSNYTSIQNTFTYEFWVKPVATHEIDTESTTSTTGITGQKYAIGAQLGSGSQAGAGVSVGTNGISVYEHASGYMPPLLSYSGTINNWVHVAVVYNNKKPSLYLNGQFKRTGLTSSKIPFPSNTFGYGIYGYFPGSIDDIRIWNYARTQTQIQNDMYKELAGNEAGLTGYWKLNTGSGNTASDSAGTNNGTISGATWNQYSVSGNRLSAQLNLPAVTSRGSQIKWNSVVPASANMTVETNVFLGGSWQGWHNVTNNGTIPGIANGTNLTGGKIQYRVNMSTSDTALSPRLQDISIRLTSNSTVSQSVYPGTSYIPSRCMNCHEPHGKTGISFYRRADGNNLCISCHDDPANVRPANYSYKGIATYNGTPHGSMGPIPNPGLYTNPVMSPGYCVICHNPHGKNDGTGYTIPKQLQLSQDQLCFGGGSGCHSDSANSTLGVSIQNRFTAGSNETARHSISPQEQTAQNTQVQCVNCHDPHLNTATNKIVDPDNRYTIYNGLDTSIQNYISSTGEIYLLAKARHDGIPPVITTGPTIGTMTQTSVPINWTTNEVTTGVVEWGPTTGLGSTINSTAKTSHTVTLSPLTLFQNYYYRVKAIDALGNFIQTATVAVDPDPPNITSGPAPANPRSGGVDMLWTTNEVSTSWVDYVASVSYSVYGWTYKTTRGNDTLTTSHSVYLDGLSTEPGTEYKYRVMSKDMRGNERTSEVSTFRLSTPPPAPTVVAEEDHLDYNYTTTASLNWNSVTDPDGDTVQYYVQISNTSNFSSGVQNSGWISGTNWNVSISNNEYMVWYWRVKARDQHGFESGWSSPVDSFVHEGYYEPVYSCPILYTWNGEKYEFITDIVAGSNIGLKLAPGKYLVPAPDEQLAIPGEQLKEKDGKYILKLKNERHEIDYIDNLVLQAIDHPIGTKITLNDFVRGSQPYKVYTYNENVRPVKKATYINNPTYSGGKKSAPVDITGLVSAIDNKHAEGKIFDDNQFTFDLGDLSDAKEIKLIVKGWTKFANEQERVERVLKAKQGVKTAPRLLEVLQPDGSWKSEEIKQIPGYTKTAVIDLTGKFPEGTRKYIVRLRGLYRPYLDYVGVDTTPQSKIKITDLELLTARLSYRGMAQYSVYPVPHHDYNKITGEERRHDGRFTKFGDVFPLVNQIDDKLVVMDTGDELTLRFKAIPPPAPGMTRSFVLKPWAYYKELVAAKVEPMPFRNMDFTNYPQSLGEYPEELKQYVKEWNTRVHEAGVSRPKNILGKLKEIFANIFKVILELWKTTIDSDNTVSDNSARIPVTMGTITNSGSAEGSTSTQTGYYGNQAPVDIRAFEQGHFSINTDYVSLRVDNTVTSTEFTMNSADSGMWESSTEPTPSIPGTDRLASNKAQVTSSNNVRWSTEYYTTPNQDDGRFNYQMFKFKSIFPRQNTYSIKTLWEGYGEPTSGYNVSLSLWNFTQSRWDELKSQHIPSETSVTLIKSKDYKPYCLKCHDGTPPSDVQLGPYTRNISSTYSGDYHGDLTGIDDPGSTIKPTYSRGVSLPCVDCHDLHGSQNAYHLRENVNGTSNLSVPSMTAVNKYDTSNNAATLTYCQSCHAGTLDNFHMEKCLSCHRAVGSSHEGWTNTSPQAGDFSRACTYCHTHGGYMPAHGTGCGHCYMNTNAKAF